MSTPLSGVSIDLSNLGSYITDTMGIYTPLFLIAAGLIVGAAVLSKGLGFFGRAAGSAGKK